MDSLIGKTFQGKDIAISSQTTYINCKFVKCHFFYTGGDVPLVNCQIENCQVTITGEAGKVVQFMQMVGVIAPVPQAPPALSQMPDSGALH